MNTFTKVIESTMKQNIVVNLSECRHGRVLKRHSVPLYHRCPVSSTLLLGRYRATHLSVPEVPRVV